MGIFDNDDDDGFLTKPYKFVTNPWTILDFVFSLFAAETETQLTIDTARDDMEA